MFAEQGTHLAVTTGINNQAANSLPEKVTDSPGHTTDRAVVKRILPDFAIFFATVVKQIVPVLKCHTAIKSIQLPSLTLLVGKSQMVTLQPS